MMLKNLKNLTDLLLTRRKPFGVVGGIGPSRSFGFQSHSRPKRIIVMRHAESMGNVDPSAYSKTPDWKIPISERGLPSANAKVSELTSIIGDDPVFVYTSPYKRTKQTAKLLLDDLSPKQILGVREEPRIVEQQFGNLQNVEAVKNSKEERHLYGRFFYRFPNGESGLDVYNRTTGFISTFFRDMSSPELNPHTADLNVVIVTHGLTLRLLIMRWFRYTVEEFEGTENPDNSDFVVLERREALGKAGSGGLSLRMWYEMTAGSLEKLKFPPAHNQKFLGIQDLEVDEDTYLKD